MNEPTFDPARSSAIKQMLMDTVANDTSTKPGIAKRAILVISLTITAALLAAGGAALALSGQLDFAPAPVPAPTHTHTHTAPTPTPTPSPTVTPTPSQNTSAPLPTVPVDCATLAPTSAVADVMPDPALGEDEPPFTPQYAALQQGGVLRCFWFTRSAYSYLSVYAATDASAGYADVASLRANGAESLDVGDASAVTCDTITIGCTVSIVAGPYWLNFEYRGPSDSAGLSRLADVARGMVSVLQQHPTPRPTWHVPSTSWAPVAGCSDLSTSTPMADVIGSPGMTGPHAFKPGAENGIVRTQADFDNCYWSVPNESTTPAGQIRSIAVQVAPGSQWAYEEVESEGTQTSVAGAQAASMICETIEGADRCWLNVLTDGSWMQLGYGDYFTPDQKPKLIAAAETILAAHR